MDANPLKLGIELVQKATAYDTAHEFREAVRHYDLALEYFQKAILFETNPQSRDVLVAKFREYAARSHALKGALGTPAELREPRLDGLMPAGSAAGMAPAMASGSSSSSSSSSSTGSLAMGGPPMGVAVPPAGGSAAGGGSATLTPEQQLELKAVLENGDRAQAEDKAGNYAVAYVYYQQTLDGFRNFFMKHTIGQPIRDRLQPTLIGYLQRTGQLQEYLQQLGQQQLQAAAGSSSSTAIAGSSSASALTGVTINVETYKTFWNSGEGIYLRVFMENNAVRAGSLVPIRIRVDNYSNKHIHSVKFYIHAHGQSIREVGGVLGEMLHSASGAVMDKVSGDDQSSLRKHHMTKYNERVERQRLQPDGKFPMAPNELYEGWVQYQMPRDLKPTELSHITVYTREYNVRVETRIMGQFSKNAVVEFPLIVLPATA